MIFFQINCEKKGFTRFGPFAAITADPADAAKSAKLSRKIDQTEEIAEF